MLEQEGYNLDVARGNVAQSVNSPNAYQNPSDFNAFYDEIADEFRQYCLKGTNPNYKSGVEWQINCQRCVSAYEARIRGYDVEALPVPDGKDYLPIMNHSAGWPSVYKNAELINCSANSGVEARTLIEEKLGSWDDYCRAIVRVRWKPEYGGGGHVFIAERIAGDIRFIDPQNGETDAKSYFELAKGDDVYCMRIDNLEFTERINLCCKNREDDK